MRRLVPLALAVLVACAAVWVLVRDPSGSPEPPHGRDDRPAAAPTGPTTPVTTLEPGARPTTDAAVTSTAPVVADPVTRASPRATDRPSSVADRSDQGGDEGRGVEPPGSSLGAWIERWRSDEDALPLPEGAVMGFDDELPPPLPPVTGVVRRRSDGAPIEGASVGWSPVELARIFLGTSTDAEGRFGLARSGDPREVLLFVQEHGYADVSCFAPVGGEVEVWLDEEATLEVEFMEDGSPWPRLRAVAGPPWLQPTIDAQAPGDHRSVHADVDAPDHEPEPCEVVWRRLPPGDYDLIGPRRSTRLTLAGGEVRRVRLDEATARGRLTITVLTPDHQQPAGEVSLQVIDPHGGHAHALVTDERGRFEGVALGGTYRVAARLSTAPWQPELERSALTEVDLGTISSPGDHTLVLPRLVPFELALQAPPSLELPSAELRLLCLAPGHECSSVADVEDGVARGALHPGRYAAFDGLRLLGEVDLPATRALTVTPQELAVRWRPGVDLDREHAMRGRAWLTPARLARRGPGWSAVDLPELRDVQAHAFMADAHGRLTGDPVLARASGGLMTFFAPGRYVLEGWSDLGPFRVEVDLPAPDGVDVDLSPR